MPNKTGVLFNLYTYHTYWKEMHWKVSVQVFDVFLSFASKKYDPLKRCFNTF